MQAAETLIEAKFYYIATIKASLFCCLLLK